MKIEEAMQYYDPRGFSWRGRNGHLKVNPLTRDPMKVLFLNGSQVPMDQSKFAPVNAVWPN